MGGVLTGMEYVYSDCLTMAEISLAVFGLMVIFFAVYLILGKI